MSNLKKESSTVSNKSGGGQTGVSLYLAFIIMTILLAIALGINSIFLGQIQTIRMMGNSVLAFYAADAGIEKVLVDRANPDLTPDYYNGASYQVIVTRGGIGDCAADHYCITSVGIYKETKRAIEIMY